MSSGDLEVGVLGDFVIGMQAAVDLTSDVAFEAA